MMSDPSSAAATAPLSPPVAASLPIQAHLLRIVSIDSSSALHKRRRDCCCCRYGDACSARRRLQCAIWVTFPSFPLLLRLFYLSFLCFGTHLWPNLPSDFSHQLNSPAHASSCEDAKQNGCETVKQNGCKKVTFGQNRRSVTLHPSHATKNERTRQLGSVQGRARQAQGLVRFNRDYSIHHGWLALAAVYEGRHDQSRPETRVGRGQSMVKCWRQAVLLLVSHLRSCVQRMERTRNVLHFRARSLRAAGALSSHGDGAGSVSGRSILAVLFASALRASNRLCHLCSRAGAASTSGSSSSELSPSSDPSPPPAGSSEAAPLPASSAFCSEPLPPTPAGELAPPPLSAVVAGENRRVF